MTNEEKRIAIAEACGWRGISKQFLVGYAPWRTKPYSDQVKSCPLGELDSIPLDPLPDYFNDLNAMHAAEKVLNKTLRLFYQSHLMKLQKADLVAGFWFLIHATAAQRAEAFLRTLNLTPNPTQHTT